MMYAKMLPCGIADFSNASEPYRIVSADGLEFMYDREGKPWIVAVTRSETDIRTEWFPLFGDVFIMSEMGKTISQFAPPTRFLGRNSEGWQGDVSRFTIPA